MEGFSRCALNAIIECPYETEAGDLTHGGGHVITGRDRGRGHKPWGAWAPRSWRTQEGGSVAPPHLDLSPVTLVGLWPSAEIKVCCLNHQISGICYSSCRNESGLHKGFAFPWLYLIHPQNSAALLDPVGCCFWGAGTHRGWCSPPVVLCLSGKIILTGHTSSLNVRYPSGAMRGEGVRTMARRHGAENLQLLQTEGPLTVVFSSCTCEMDQARQTEFPPSPAPCEKLKPLCTVKTSKLTSSSQTLGLLLTASPAHVPQIAGLRIPPSPASLNPARFCSVSAPGSRNTALSLCFRARECPAQRATTIPLQPRGVGRTQVCLQTSALPLGARRLLLRKRGRRAVHRPSQSAWQDAPPGPVPSPLQTPWAPDLSALLCPAPAPEPGVWVPALIRSPPACPALIALASLALDSSQLSYIKLL